jgi:hypothetical protein
MSAAIPGGYAEAGLIPDGAATEDAGASITDSTVIARGGQSPVPPPGEVFSGA